MAFKLSSNYFIGNKCCTITLESDELNDEIVKRFHQMINDETPQPVISGNIEVGNCAHKRLRPYYMGTKYDPLERCIDCGAYYENGAWSK